MRRSADAALADLALDIVAVLVVAFLNVAALVPARAVIADRGVAVTTIDIMAAIDGLVITNAVIGRGMGAVGRASDDRAGGEADDADGDGGAGINAAMAPNTVRAASVVAKSFFMAVTPFQRPDRETASGLASIRWRDV